LDVGYDPQSGYLVTDDIETTSDPVKKGTVINGDVITWKASSGNVSYTIIFDDPICDNHGKMSNLPELTGAGQYSCTVKAPGPGRYEYVVKDLHRHEKKKFDGGISDGHCKGCAIDVPSDGQ
jgi:hypothetical protein